MTDHTSQETPDFEDLGLSAADRNFLLHVLELSDLPTRDSSPESEDTVHPHQGNQCVPVLTPLEPTVHLPRIAPLDYGSQGRQDSAKESTLRTRDSRLWPDPIGPSNAVFSTLLDQLEGAELAPRLDPQAEVPVTPPSPSVYEAVAGERDGFLEESPRRLQSGQHLASHPDTEIGTRSPSQSYEQLVDTFLLDLSLEGSTSPDKERNSLGDLPPSVARNQDETSPSSPPTTNIRTTAGFRVASAPVPASHPSRSLAAGSSLPSLKIKNPRRSRFAAKVKTHLSHVFKPRREATL